MLEARDKYIRLKNPKSVTRSGLEIGDINLKVKSSTMIFIILYGVEIIVCSFSLTYYLNF